MKIAKIKSTFTVCNSVKTPLLYNTSIMYLVHGNCLKRHYVPFIFLSCTLHRDNHVIINGILCSFTALVTTTNTFLGLLHDPDIMSVCLPHNWNKRVVKEHKLPLSIVSISDIYVVCCIFIHFDKTRVSLKRPIYILNDSRNFVIICNGATRQTCKYGDDQESYNK